MEGDESQLLFMFIQKEQVKFWQMSLNLIAALEKLKKNVLRHRNSNYPYDIQRYLSNDQDYDINLRARKTDKKCKNLLNFPALTLPVRF